MNPPENCGFLSPHVTLQHSGFRLPQVHYDEAIDNIRKFSVDVESQNLAADPGVLPQQDREAFAVTLNVGDRLRELFEIANQRENSSPFPAPQECGTEWTSRLDQSGKIVFTFPRREIVVDHIARSFVVVVTDADRAEKNRDFWPGSDQSSNSLPQ